MPLLDKEKGRAYMAAYCASHREEKRDYNTAYYEENRDVILGRMKREQEGFAEWLQILRTNNGCEDCETHEGRLDLHHVDPSTKRFNVSMMAGHSLDSLEEELEKCVVLCRTCHKKRHAEMRAQVA